MAALSRGGQYALFGTAVTTLAKTFPYFTSRRQHFYMAACREFSHQLVVFLTKSKTLRQYKRFSIHLPLRNSVAMFIDAPFFSSTVMGVTTFINLERGVV
jgi:hypothetical protein